MSVRAGRGPRAAPAEPSAGARPRDVVVATRPPGGGAGRRLRTASVIRALARHADVDVLHGLHDPPVPGQELDPPPGVRLVGVRASSRPARAPRAAADLLRGTDRGWARGADRALARALDELLPGARRVIADGPVAMVAIERLARRRPVVLLGQNVESDLVDRRSVRRTEGRLLRACAEAWMCTPADVARVPAIAGEERPTRLVRNVVDVAAIAPRAGHRGSERALLLADLSWEPNRDAVRYLAEDVVPALRRRRPQAEILVAGRCDSPVADRPGLRHLGFVDDLDALYASVDAVVVPVRWGSGSPLKLVEALAHGMPVVTTPHAAALVPEARAGHELLVAGDGETFAEHVDRALAGELDALGRSARVVAEREYSIEALAEVLASTGVDAPAGADAPTGL